MKLGYNCYVPQERTAFFSAFVDFRDTNLHRFLPGLWQLWHLPILAFSQPKTNNKHKLNNSHWTK